MATKPAAAPKPDSGSPYRSGVIEWGSAKRKNKKTGKTANVKVYAAVSARLVKDCTIKTVTLKSLPVAKFVKGNGKGKPATLQKPNIQRKFSRFIMVGNGTIVTSKGKVKTERYKLGRLGIPSGISIAEAVARLKSISKVAVVKYPTGSIYRV